MFRSKVHILFLGLVLVALLAACSGQAAPTATEVPTQPQVIETSAPVVPTATSAPSATPIVKTDVTLILNFAAGGPQAGFMYAKALGYYDDVGLNVTIEEGKGSATTAAQIASGVAQIGFSDGPSIMAVIAKGGKEKIVAPILQTNGFALISLTKANITKVSDLIGKTLAVQPGTAQTTLLNAVFAANNIDSTKVNITNIDPAALVASLLQGKVDAILAGADYQAVQIRDQGYDTNVLFYRDMGVPTIGLSIVVNDDLITKNPDVVSRFVAASLKGWDAARKNPEAAAQAVADQFTAVDTASTLKQLNVDLLLLCAPGATNLGLPPAANWKTTYDLLVKYQDLPTTLPVEDYYTTEFIPKDAPTCP